ncbi:hypothetical protein HGE1_04937 [Anaplasma phagocytophilum str. HGE1]|nr:hypothetical protein YYU_05270 [Anaplasma phagocytophilum str. HZ2]AGR80919.1 hypothetical protein WSQ_05320 [Anaplasma phagocytophilum str. JM]AGR82176.1 hypothetical protein YYY_05335 [Anaplasma phagocytophilum str. Dog2]EOA61368.2 hypothetical protein HGE1_04937 [Anaplasma phagocytophilum str. HGE1]PLC10315.1 hypothetical protein C0V68_01795 [Anaplasma phagocytophilum]
MYVYNASQSIRYYTTWLMQAGCYAAEQYFPELVQVILMLDSEVSGMQYMSSFAWAAWVM